MRQPLPFAQAGASEGPQAFAELPADQRAGEMVSLALVPCPPAPGVSPQAFP